MAKIFTPTHREGCHIAANYLHRNMGCGAVFVEPNPFENKESPDAIGFRPGGVSILMEVKVGRGDFTSDKNKPHRMNPGCGMGDWRFYVCPTGMITPEDLPPKWGLMYFTPRKSLKPIVMPEQFKSLSSPQHYDDWIRTQMAQNPLRTPPYLLAYREMVDRFGHMEKNVKAEQNIMYGAYRQLCIAQQRGVAYTVDEVFQRPNI